MNLRNLTFFSLFFLTETNERLSAWMIFGAEKQLSVIIGRGGGGKNGDEIGEVGE